jgi:hypothetical protein
MAKKNYYKPAEGPRTIGGGLKAQSRERNTRNDLLPSMELQTVAIADLKRQRRVEHVAA